MENNVYIPKFKIGETIEATWHGGKKTKHTITKIEITEHGLWYEWIEEDGFKNGLHECYLSKCSR